MRNERNTKRPRLPDIAYMIPGVHGKELSIEHIVLIEEGDNIFEVMTLNDDWVSVNKNRCESYFDNVISAIRNAIGYNREIISVEWYNKILIINLTKEKEDI